MPLEDKNPVSLKIKSGQFFRHVVNQFTQATAFKNLSFLDLSGAFMLGSDFFLSHTSSNYTVQVSNKSPFGKTIKQNYRDQLITMLCDYLQTTNSLEILDLSNNNINSVELKKIVSAVARNLSHPIKVIFIQNNNFIFDNATVTHLNEKLSGMPTVLDWEDPIIMSDEAKNKIFDLTIKRDDFRKKSALRESNPM